MPGALCVLERGPPVGSPCHVLPLWFPPPQSPVSCVPRAPAQVGRPRLREAGGIAGPALEGHVCVPARLCCGAWGPGCASARHPAGGALAQGDGAGFRHHSRTHSTWDDDLEGLVATFSHVVPCLKLRGLLKHLPTHPHASEAQWLRFQAVTAMAGLPSLIGALRSHKPPDAAKTTK